MDQITRCQQHGAADEVSFTVNGLEYHARVTYATETQPRKVVTLHRVGGRPLQWTSISVANPRFARVSAVLWQLLAERYEQAKKIAAERQAAVTALDLGGRS